MRTVEKWGVELRTVMLAWGVLWTAFVVAAGIVSLEERTPIMVIMQSAALLLGGWGMVFIASGYGEVPRIAA